MDTWPEWAENLCFGLDLRRGEWSGAMEQGVRGGIRSGTPRRKSRRKPTGNRDERTFWRLERTGAGGVRDARCLWREPKGALVAVGTIGAAFAALAITRLHGQVLLSHRLLAEATPSPNQFVHKSGAAN